MAAGRPVARSRVELARVPALVLVLAAAVVAGGVLLGCAGHAEAQRPARAAGAGRRARGAGDVETGHASYYGPKFNGRRTASGERYDPRKLTAAHKSLPLGTWIRVTRTSGGGDGGPGIQSAGPHFPRQRGGLEHKGSPARVGRN